MDGSPQYEFITTELDADLVVGTRGVQTNWQVLTGAACCGKTTLINQLAAKGFKTLPEAARQYIDGELAKGRTFAEMFGNAADEICMTDMQREAERRLRTADIVFLDRALPDSITFYRFCGLDPNELVADCLRRRYAAVFLLDRLPFRQDGARLEHDATSDLLDTWLARDYGTLGYDVVRVPVRPPEERLAFVLNCLTVWGAI
jgi:predicted ATPase